jgi:hypothetical protein
MDDRGYLQRPHCDAPGQYVLVVTVFFSAVFTHSLYDTLRRLFPSGQLPDWLSMVLLFGSPLLLITAVWLAFIVFMTPREGKASRAVQALAMCMMATAATFFAGSQKQANWLGS